MNRMGIIIAAIVVIVVGAGAYWFGARGGLPETTQQAQANLPGDLNPNAPSSPSGQRPIGHMRLEAQFYGPLKSTLVQRWRDEESGVLCYIYLPIIVAHSKPLPNGLVFYGSNTLGSISCR